MKSKPIALIVVAAAMLTSCAGDDVLAELSEPKEILFSVSEASSETRAGITTDNISNFGISITNPVSSQYTYNNVKVDKSGADGKWTPTDQLLWHNLTDTVDIVAMSPYSSQARNLCGVSNYAVSVKADQTKGVEDSDFLVWKATAFVPKRDLNSDGTLGIEFKHAMCLLEIRAYNSETTDAEVNGPKLQGVVDFTLDDPVVTAIGNGGTVRCFPQSLNSYSCILIPQDIAAKDFSIELSTATTTYKWVPNEDIKFESGKTYTIEIPID
jgi:hypothetical protein